MSSHLQSTQWHTAWALHQILLLSCDYTELQTWSSANLCVPFRHDRPGAYVKGAVLDFTLPNSRSPGATVDPHIIGCKAHMALPREIGPSAWIRTVVRAGNLAVWDRPR